MKYGNKIYKNLFWIIIISQIFLFSDCDNELNIEPRDGKAFIKIFGREYSDEAIDLIQLDDGGFVLLGTSTERPEQENEQAPRDIFLVFTDSEGNESEYYYPEGGESRDEVPMIMKKYGNNIYFTGYAIYENDETDILAGSFSVTGREYDWFNIYSEPGNEIANDLEMINYKQMDQLILAGKKSDSLLYYSFIDFNGNQREDGFPLPNLRNPNSNLINILTFNEQPIIHVLVEGRRIIEGQNTKEIYIAYDDFSNGSIQGNELGSNIPENDIPVNMIQSGRIPNQLIVLGYIEENNIPGSLIVIKIPYNEADGTITQINIKPEILNEITGILPARIIETNDGGYAILGKNVQGISDSGRIVLIKLDNTLALEWQRNYGTGELSDSPGALIQDMNSDYIFNSTVSFNENETNTKVALFKTDMMGNLDF